PACRCQKSGLPELQAAASLADGCRVGSLPTKTGVYCLLLNSCDGTRKERMKIRQDLSRLQIARCVKPRVQTLLNSIKYRFRFLPGLLALCCLQNIQVMAAVPLNLQ